MSPGKRRSEIKGNPTIQGAPPRNRVFAAFPVALQAIIVDHRRRVLLLSSPSRNGANQWQTVSGGMEAGETVLDGVLREVAEEVGPAVRVRPLRVVHAQSFRFDERIPTMIGIYYVLAYEGGKIQPGDDMADAAWRWWDVDELATAVAAGDITLAKSTHLWMLRQAAAPEYPTT